MANTQPPKKLNNVMFVQVQTVKNTNARCHQLNKATAKSSTEIKWTWLLVLLMAQVCMEQLKRNSTHWDCSEVERLIFAPVHDARKPEPSVHYTPFYWRNIIASHRFCPTKTQPGAMLFYSWKHAELLWLKFNTSHTMNSCQLFWDNKLWTKKVCGKCNFVWWEICDW